MRKEDNTEATLIAELAETRKEADRLRAKVAQLESRLSENTRPPHPRPPRREIQAVIEFIADFDLVEARGVDLSEGGICFETDRDLPFEMQFDLAGGRYQKRAHLVWVRRIGGSRYRLGLQFVEPEPAPEF